ncbi:replication protein [Chitiniphilus shinanonensis]|uniref:replication protein n=1 Tax=Chitiniphilus shinanonensis TaxID=553088 RepID=UPI003341C13B
MQQEGFFAIPNAVEDALLRSPLTHRQERVYRAILRKTLGYGKTSDYIATSQLAAMTGLDDSDVRKALAALVDMGMLERGNRRSFGTEITPNLDPETWDCKQGKSPRLPPRTGRITPNKQGELPPTKDNSKRQRTTTADAVGAPTAVKTQKKTAPVPYQEIVDAYHATLVSMPKVAVITDKRRSAMRTFWAKFDFNLDKWGAYLRFIASHCQWMLEDREGSNGRTWHRKNIDFLLTERCYLGVKELRYGGQS